MSVYLYSWNLFTLLLLLSFLANGVLGIVIWAVDPRSALNRLYAVLCLAIAMWAANKLGIAYSGDAATAAFHYKLSGVGWCLLPSLFLNFVVIFVGKTRQRLWRVLIVCFYVISAGLLLALWLDLGMLHGMHRGHWGFTDEPGPVYKAVFEPFLLGGFVLSIVELVRYARSATGRGNRIRALLVLGGLLLPLLGGATTDMVLPSFGIYPFELAVPLTTANVGIIAFAMVRYRLLTITAEFAARTIVDTMGDALLVLGPEQHIRLVNPAALALLGYEADEILGLPAARVCPDGPLPKEVEGGAVAWDQPRKAEKALITRAGERVDVSLTVAALRDRRGMVLGYVCVAKDIRELKALIAEIEAARSALEALAVTDDLTGLHNRRFLMLKLREELLRSRRFEHPFSLVMVDLDHFKRVNDEHGHDEGDRVLRIVADVLRAEVRSIDTAARYGGDEFVILLPETPETEAMQVADRVRAALAGDALPEAYRFVTASLGVATYDPGKPEPDEGELFRLADSALLQAKRTGKNRVVHSHASAQE